MIKINKKALLLIIISAFTFLFLLSGNVKAGEVHPIDRKEEFLAVLSSAEDNLRLDCDIELTNSDLNKNYYFNIYSDTVLDLNGHTITVSKNLGGEYGIVVLFKNNNCTLTITDNDENGKMTVKDSTISLFQVSNSNGNEEPFSGCNVVIDGGTFEGPTSRKPIIATSTSEKIGFTVNDGTFVINYDAGSVFANNAFDLHFIKMTVKGGISSGEFVITPDSTEISDVIDADSDIWVDGIRKYTDSPRTAIGAVSCYCNSETGIVIKPKNVYNDQIVTTIEGLKQAIATPEVETIVLDDYIETSEDLNIIINGNKKTIDLNGCDLRLIGESKIVAKYYTNHDVEFRDERVKGTIYATDEKISTTRNIIEPINYTNGNINMIINGASVYATSEWIFTDKNHYHLTINNGYFQSQHSLFKFNSSYESSVTLNRLILRNYDNDSGVTIKLARNKFSGDPLSTIIGSESKLIYVDGQEDFVEVPKTAICGEAFSGDGTLNIMPIKGLEIPKVTIPSLPYGYSQPEKQIILKNTSEETLTIDSKQDIKVIDDDGYFNGNIVNAGTSFPLEILPGKKIENALSIRPVENLTPGVYKATILICTTDNDEYRGKIEFEVTKAQPTLSVDISNWGYGESTAEPIYSNDVQLKDGEELKEKIEYAVKPEEGSNAQPVFSTEVPKHAGKYIVKYTTEETDYYFAGTATKEFEITRKEMVPQISVDEENHTYTGTQIKPEVTVKITDGQEITLVKGEDYTVEYVDNINKGEGTIKVKSAATSNYILKDHEDKEVFEKKFNILAKEIQASDIEVTDRMGYTGQALTPDVKVRVNGKALVKDTEYTVSFEGQDRKPGQQIDITVEGKGNYTGTVIKHTNIIEKMKQGLSFATSIINKKYTDSKFTIVATHNVGDGVISYKSSNTNVAKINSKTGEVTIVGVGNAEIIATASETDLYKQTETKYTLRVNKADYDTSKIKFENMSFAYDGKSHSIVANGIPTGVRVSYTNNEKTDVGTYQVTASFTGDYAHYNSIPNKIAILTITNKNIVSSTVSGIKDKTYTGKNLTQALVIKNGNTTLKEGIDYTVAYNSNKKIGIATITIIGKGNYAGIITRTFKINPKGTSLKKLTAGSKQFKATWKAQKTQTTGYEVQYSTNKNFKSGNKKVNIKKNKTTSSTVKKLKAKKKYYVRIRTYKNVNGKKFYSDWSKVLNVKTKK